MGETVTAARLWRELQSGGARPIQVLRMFILLSGGIFLAGTAMLFLDWQHQAVLAVLTLVAAIAVNHWSNSQRSSEFQVATLMLVLLSVYSTLRYGFWRISSVVAWFNDPATKWAGRDSIFVLLLLLAECYAFVALLLGYLQTLSPLRRSPVPLPSDPEQWPAVDLVIPTYDEPLELVRSTVLAALNIDWPAGKLNVYLLDDGRRNEFRVFADQAGIRYIARDNNLHAKAGNINHALQYLHADFVAMFDCDHVATRSFLQLTMGWFLRDEKLAVLQTPQQYYSPDPFERNLDEPRSIPNEDELFYSTVQDGNDLWNAAMFCGTSAVVRRSALDDCGGIATDTVTEDAHTSLRMQMRGWNTAYINIPQAAGLAAERLRGHVEQRVRWARGMVQILRRENPLLARGLSVAQRLCYFNAMSHFLFALPRLIFLTAPALYLIFGIRSLPGSWMAIVAYALPHLMLGAMTSSRIQGRHRHLFWNEVYETTLAPFLVLPTLSALIRPRATRFNVTAKGGVVKHGFFDLRIALPFIALGSLNAIALLCAVARLVHGSGSAGTICVNVLWTLFNLMILGVATSAAWERQQRRRSVRLVRTIPSDVLFSDGTMIQSVTSDLSNGGVRTRLNQAAKAQAGEAVQFVFPLLDGSATLAATIVAIDGDELRAQFDSLDLQDYEALTTILYSRADAWLGTSDAYEPDRALRSLLRMIRIPIRSVARIARRRKRAVRDRAFVTSAVPVIALALLAPLARSIHAAQMPRPAATSSATHSALQPELPGETHAFFTLKDVGAEDAIRLQGLDATRSVTFAFPQNETVTAATLRLRYRFSPGLLPGLSQLNVSVNGRLVDTIPVAVSQTALEQGAPLESVIALPAELLVRSNRLSFQFVGHYAAQCEDPSNSTLWAWIDPLSTIEVAGSVVPLTNDLKLLPLPFYGEGTNLQPVIPIVFLAAPSTKALQAAGIVASWLGVLHGPDAVRFTVSVGEIPAGNAIVIAEDASSIPSALGVLNTAGPAVSLATNLVDSSSTLLIISGGGNDLVTATAALALHADSWQGSQVSVRAFVAPAARHPDDAPRWLSTEGGENRMGEAADLEADGSEPVSLSFNLPPDLAFGERQNLGFHLSYRYNGIPLGNDSTLQIYVNGAFVSSTPLPHTGNASSVLDTVIPVPVGDLRPFSNTISFQFVFRPAVKGNCAVAAPNDLHGAILKDSFLDISDIPHSALLPNLALFANAGYPFTRSADLAETTVILPAQPSTAEVEMFLTLMGHFGAQTGYPAVGVTVGDSSSMRTDGTRDYLILGAAQDQPALQVLGSSLPAEVTQNGLLIHDTHSLFAPSGWWQGRASSQPASGELAADGGLPDALIEATEWPVRSTRSVVAIVVRDDAMIPGFLAALLANSQGTAISQSVSVLHGEQFSSYRMGNAAYRVGRISLVMGIETVFQDAPWLVAIVTVIFCFLMAAILHAMLRRRARLRLQAEES
jgi:cellulose synthase (UDP-forming)